MSKTLVIVLAMVALGMFAIAGSVIYVSQQQQEKQQQEKPSACNKPYFLYQGECIKVVPKTEPNPLDTQYGCIISRTSQDGDIDKAIRLCEDLYPYG